MVDFSENKAILERAAEALGISGTGWNKKLAKALDIDPTVLSAWKTRNQIDYEKLRKKMTAEQFLYATKGAKAVAPSFAPSDYVSRTEFLSELLLANKRIDHLKGILDAILREHPDLAPKASPEAS